MAYPTHYLLQFGGPRGDANNEIWSCGIRMIAVGGQLSIAETQDYLEDVCVPALKGWMTRAGSLVTNHVKLNFAKLNEIAPSGLYANPGSTVESYFANHQGGSVGPINGAMGVWQVAVALTWETDATSRGLASRGRIYSPAPAVASSPGTGLFPTSEAQGMATSAGVLLKDLKGGGGAGTLVPNIVSQGKQTGPDTYGAGVAHRIDRVTVDNRVDIIRKRANSLEPARVTAVVPA